MKKTLILALFGASALTASAVTVTVLPGDPSWASTGNSGGGFSAVTATAPRSGNGSLELLGDRTRFNGLGNPFSQTSNLGQLNALTGFSFDWMVAVGSVGIGPGVAASYSPALRLHIWDGAQRSELIWENAYNTNVSAVQGTWYSSGSADNFWRFESGAPGDSQSYDRTVAEWLLPGTSANGRPNYSANAYIAAISVGVGSSVGSNYHAFADNVTLTFGASTTTYNFEASAASVPDGGATAALLATVLLSFAALRRRFTRV